MTIVMQLCLVVLTLAVVALAVVAIRLMRRFNELSQQVTMGIEEFRASMEEARRTSSEARAVIRSVAEIAEDVRGVSTRFERIGNHAMDLASAVVDEIERPVRQALALFQGVRIGTTAFARRVTHRNGVSPFNGGKNDVRHEEPV